MSRDCEPSVGSLAERDCAPSVDLSVPQDYEPSVGLSAALECVPLLVTSSAAAYFRGQPMAVGLVTAALSMSLPASRVAPLVQAGFHLDCL